MKDLTISLILVLGFGYLILPVGMAYGEMVEVAKGMWISLAISVLFTSIMVSGIRMDRDNY